MSTPENTLGVYLLAKPTKFEQSLARQLGRVQKAVWKTFSSGERFVNVSAPAAKVIVIGRTHPPAENIWETLLLLDTLKRNGVADLPLVLPYFGYARQDRAFDLGDPVTASALSTLMAAAGAHRIVTVELHSPRVLETSPIPIFSVNPMPLLASSLADEYRGRGCVVVAPDKGSRVRAAVFAEALGVGIEVVSIEKVRNRHGKVTAKRLEGNISGDTAVIVDDMVDTGGTVIEAVRLLRKAGIKKMDLVAVHPIFSDGAIAKVKNCGFGRILISDSYPAPAKLLAMKNVRVVSSLPLFAGPF